MKRSAFDMSSGRPSFFGASRQPDATGLPSGVYFYRLEAGGYMETKSLILSK